jgi:hypothetical protein
MQHPKFQYRVYNPCYHSVDVARDWGLDILDTTTDINIALAQPYRVAAIRVFYDQPWIHSYDPELIIDLSQFDLVLFSDVEYYTQADIEAWINEQHVQQYVLALGGINVEDSLKENQVYRPYWIRRFMELNEYTDTNANSKPYLFDALLGARRPNRDYVMLSLDRIGLLDQSLVTYRNCFPGAVVNEQNTHFQSLFPNPLKWPYVSPHLDTQWEVGTVVDNTISFNSPLDIYRRTWYSIICETIGTGSTFFLSEKTIKAMYNQRIFVVFGPQGYLRQLRNMGFATFDGIIDESYDDEPRDSIRFQKAMHQVMQLAWFENPIDMYASMQGALEQNQRRLYELEEKRSRDLRELLHRHIPGEHWLW